MVVDKKYPEIKYKNQNIQLVENPGLKINEYDEKFKLKTN